MSAKKKAESVESSSESVMLGGYQRKTKKSMWSYSKHLVFTNAANIDTVSMAVGEDARRALAEGTKSADVGRRRSAFPKRASVWMPLVRPSAPALNR